MDPKNRLNDDEDRVNANIGRVRARRHRLRDDHVTLAHGAGGKASAALVENVFWEIFGGDVLPDGGDSAVLPLDGLLGAGAGDGGAAAGSLAMSTDSYVVNPIEFPGGDIGELAVNGTVNDLAVAGAVPKAITAAFVLEEGLPIEVLRRIVESMARAAEAAGVGIVAGDTKVVPRGACDKLYITTAGVGVVPAGRRTGYSEIEEGDRIIVSGPIADHGMAVMMARGDLAIDAPIQSDTRAVNGLVEALFAAVPDVRFLRDATRGGLATVMNELARGSGKGIALDDGAIAVRDMTRAACDMLGIDPLYVANEGTFAAVVPEAAADAAVAALHDAGAPEARAIGRVVAEPAASVVLVTGFGGTRMVDMLVGDPLPRIC
ncbi:hydrogenase expression/formation protein HypE [Corynebacterium sp. NPDC060344]|uniref:hydrogenase expression/formation protein HypE n=1 Tax=Corynebacterium sp. NPDC060344 TaxID=3347101 RepID=UPI003657A9FF